MRIADRVSFRSFLLGRTTGSVLEGFVHSPVFRELMEDEVNPNPTSFSLESFAGGVNPPSGGGDITSFIPQQQAVRPSGSLGGFSLQSSPQPEVMDVATQRAARFGRSPSESDIDVAGMGR